MDNILQIITEKEEGRWISSGTSLKGYIDGVTYTQLLEEFGHPLYGPEDSGDGKIQFEWVFKHNGNVFTLYDWKTYDLNYTITELTRWNVGGKSSAMEFIEDIENILKDKQ